MFAGKVQARDRRQRRRGVWNMEKQWPGLQTQNTKDNFQFPEMRPNNPNDWDNDFPTQEQVNRYLQDYIDKFDLNEHVHYNTQVKSLSKYYDFAGPLLFEKPPCLTISSLKVTVCISFA